MVILHMVILIWKKRQKDASVVVYPDKESKEKSMKQSLRLHRLLVWKQDEYGEYPYQAIIQPARNAVWNL